MINLESIFNRLNKTDTCKVLSDVEILKLDYSFLPNSPVWKIETEISFKRVNKPLTLYMNFPDDFPYSIPKIYIKKEIYDEIKFIPHINKDFSICIFDEGINNVYPIESINDIVEYIIHQAKSIIKNSEAEEYNIEEFKREFKAYWEIEYDNRDKTSNSGLHLLNSVNPELINGVRLKNKLFNYEFILYNEGQSWDIFKKYLDYRELKYETIKVFCIDKIFTNPPYNLTYKQSLEIIKKLELYNNFKTSIKISGLGNILVIFSNTINDKTEIYGWSYNNLLAPLSTLKGTRKKLSGIEILEHSFFGKSNVLRITFDNLTPERLQLRTSGILENHKSVVVSGLGSLGSNLIYFLQNLSINKFHLIDNEGLRLENINRHYLGFNYINNSKVLAIKDKLIKSNPFCEVDVLLKAVQNVITECPNFINDCDFHIICIGETMIENLILNSIIENKITKPIILFWVEPFLASGQMLFINPIDAVKAIDLINNYKYNILSNEISNRDKTYLKEGSCQTGYFPYSSTYLIQFLSAMFPYLKTHINEENMVSTIYSWIGNKDLLKEKYLEITDFAKEKNSYELIINHL